MAFSHRPLLLVAVVLLLVAAFGGLSVGVPLVFAVLTTPASVEPGRLTSIVPASFLAYGLLSLGGAIGLLAGWRRTTVAVVVSQGIVTLGLGWLYVAVVADVSLLIVAGIAGGAALCAAGDRLLGRPA